MKPSEGAGGREQAHEAIKEHAVQVVRDLRVALLKITCPTIGGRAPAFEQRSSLWHHGRRSGAIGRASEQVEAFCQQWPKKCSSDLRRATLTPAQFFKIALRTRKLDSFLLTRHG